jgi:putative FmdB family regulatory protein
MPTYEYACRTCGEHLEVVQSFKDDPLTECPACQGQLRKVFSAAGIIFKGSGWHVKDYSSASSRAASGPSGSSSGEPGTKGADSSAATSGEAASSSASSSSSSSAEAASA